MHAVTTPQARMDAYLAQLRRCLRSLPAEQATDIVEEIRSYIRDKAGASGSMTEASLGAALSRLGTPTALAASYLTERLMVCAQRNQMPWTILRAIFHW